MIRVGIWVEIRVLHSSRKRWGFLRRVIFGPRRPAWDFVRVDEGRVETIGFRCHRPSGKDGQYCYRFTNDIIALKGLSAEHDYQEA